MRVAKFVLLTAAIFMALTLASTITAEATGPGDTGPDVTEIQAHLTWGGWPVAIDGIYGPQTTRTIKAFQRANGLLADGVVGSMTEAALGIAPAVRGQQVQLEPPPPPPPVFSSASANGRCVGAEPLLAQFSPGWDVARMSGIMYRESRCQPSASNSCCSGLLQIHRSWIDNAAVCGVYSRNDLYDPARNVCAAAIVYRTQGIGAWSTA